MSTTEGTYYAWAPIYYDATVDPSGAITERKMVLVGDTVDQSIMSEEDFNYLVSTGAIRTEPYPEEINLTAAPSQLQSPQQVLARRARLAMEAATQQLPTGGPTRSTEGSRAVENPT